MRLRTLPLSAGGVILGILLAVADWKVDPWTAVLIVLTTISLQILSNLSNELGDTLHGTDTADGRESFAREACALLSSLEPVERDRYIPFVAERSGLSRDTVREQCGVSEPQESANNRRIYRQNKAVQRQNDSERARCERVLLACMMSSAEAALEIEKRSDFSYMLFSDAGLARAFNPAR